LDSGGAATPSSPADPPGELAALSAGDESVRSDASISS